MLVNELTILRAAKYVGAPLVCIPCRAEAFCSVAHSTSFSKLYSLAVPSPTRRFRRSFRRDSEIICLVVLDVLLVLGRLASWCRTPEARPTTIADVCPEVEAC